MNSIAVVIMWGMAILSLVIISVLPSFVTGVVKDFITTMPIIFAALGIAFALKR